MQVCYAPHFEVIGSALDGAGTLNWKTDTNRQRGLNEHFAQAKQWWLLSDDGIIVGEGDKPARNRRYPCVLRRMYERCCSKDLKQVYIFDVMRKTTI